LEKLSTLSIVIKLLHRPPNLYVVTDERFTLLVII